MAVREGVTSQTIRRWVASGKYQHVKLTPNGQIRLGIQESGTLGYARVSSKKQKSSLQAQTQEILLQYPEAEIVTDIGSGFNFKRRGLISVLERALRGDAIHVVVSDDDRLARAGRELIRFVIESAGGQLTTLHSDSKKSQFDPATLVEFITSFCNSYYGKRSARRKKDKNIS